MDVTILKVPIPERSPRADLELRIDLVQVIFDANGSLLLEGWTGECHGGDEEKEAKELYDTFHVAGSGVSLAQMSTPISIRGQSPNWTRRAGATRAGWDMDRLVSPQGVTATPVNEQT